MATSTFELDLTAGAFATVGGTPFGLAASSGGTYQSAIKYSGAGATSWTRASAHHMFLLRDSNYLTNGAQRSGVYVDFFCYLSNANTSGILKIAGGAYIAYSVAIGVNAAGNMCSAADATSGPSTVASGSPAVPAGQWVRFAYRPGGDDPTRHGEARLFKGANILGTVPDATLPDGLYGSQGYELLGPGSATGNTATIYIDSVIMSNDGWPTRGAPPPASSPKGWWITKPS